MHTPLRRNGNRRLPPRAPMSLLLTIPSSPARPHFLVPDSHRRARFPFRLQLSKTLILRPFCPASSNNQIFSIFIMDNEIMKNQIAESSSVEANDNIEMQNFSQLGGTSNDEHDMRLLGRTQVLNVRRSENSKPSKQVTDSWISVTFDSSQLLGSLVL